MPPPRMHGGRKAKDPKKTFLRLLKYMLQYKFHLAMVLICIFAHALVQSRSAVMLGTLVDDYILPMVDSGSSDFAPLVSYLIQIGLIFLMGMVASFLFQFLMVSVSQGTLKVIRDEMFTKMQKLPLRYFDSNTAGNLMSRYTSDIDTLRQMISMSIPQTISAVVTLVVLFITTVSYTHLTLPTILLV